MINHKKIPKVVDGMKKLLGCSSDYSRVNEENTPCGKCGSRKHCTLFDGFIRCSWCNNIIDDLVITA